MKTQSRSAVLLVALSITPSIAGVMLTGCGKTIATQTRPGTDDLSITARVKTALLNDPEIGPKIDVATANGVVTLSGVVRTPAERDKAVAVARKVTGVTDVKAALQVQ